MKRAVSILCVAVLLISMLALAGCGSGLDGNYKLTEMSSSGVTMDPSTLGVTITLTVNGSTATMTGMSAMTGGDNDTETLTVDTKAKTFTSADGTSIPYTVDGKKLTLEQNGAKMVFEKQ